MKNPNDNFLKGRLRSVKFALRGIWILIRTEDSIKVQLFCAFLVTIFGFLFQLSSTEWMIQFLTIGLVLVAETMNTAIEKLSDFIHPSYHKKIGLIKDISAGAPTFAAIIALIIAAIIYLPKIIIFF